MALFLPRQWRKQPLNGAQVNWAHPLARGLVYCQLPGTSRAGFFRLVDPQIKSVDFSGGLTPGIFTTTIEGTANGVGIKGRSSLANKAGGTGGLLSLYSSLESGNPTYTYAGVFERRAFDTAQSSVATFAINAGSALTSITQNAGSSDSTFLTRFVDNQSVTQNSSALVNNLIADKKLNVVFSVYKNGQAPVGIVNNSQLTLSNSTVYDGVSTSFGGNYINSTGTYVGIASFFWLRVLSQAEYALFTENPWQIFAPARPVFYSLPITFQYSRPTADILTGWNSTGATHFSQIDEAVSDSNDYVFAPALGSVDSFTLSELTQPPAGSSIDLHFNAASTKSEPASIKFEVFQGATLIKSQTVSPTGSNQTITISSGELSGVSWPWTPTLRVTSQ